MAQGLFDGERDAIANAANLASLLAMGLPDLNWSGFYFLRGEGLVLGPFQGRPACVRIEMGKGVCGTAAADARDRDRARCGGIPRPHRLRCGVAIRNRSAAREQGQADRRARSR